MDSSLDDGGMTVLVWALWRDNSVCEMCGLGGRWKKSYIGEGEVYSGKRMGVNKQLYYPNHPSSI